MNERVLRVDDDAAVLTAYVRSLRGRFHIDMADAIVGNCFPGYSTSNPPTANCLADGSWSSIVGLCVRK